jgi:hypothetical protein
MRPAYRPWLLTVGLGPVACGWPTRCRPNPFWLRVVRLRARGLPNPRSRLDFLLLFRSLFVESTVVSGRSPVAVKAEVLADGTSFARPKTQVTERSATPIYVHLAGQRDIAIPESASRAGSEKATRCAATEPSQWRGRQGLLGKPKKLFEGCQEGR